MRWAMSCQRLLAGWLPLQQAALQEEEEEEEEEALVQASLAALHLLCTLGPLLAAPSLAPLQEEEEEEEAAPTSLGSLPLQLQLQSSE